MEALGRAGANAKGVTAYVTLEPCAHEGETPSCANALGKAGVARAVIAIRDPDPRTAGKGIAALEEAGVEVIEDICSDEALDLNFGFFSKVIRKRPMVTLKLATSLDGRIATHSGNSKWITGPAAREEAHLLRAQHDALMVGSNTALIDNPELTCRLTGLEDRSPIRIVADSRLRLPLTSVLVATAGNIPTWAVTNARATKERHKAFEDVGVTLIDVPEHPEEGLDLAKALEAFANRGVTRLLVEGGSHLAASLLRAKLVDRIVWFRAPVILGGDGLPALQALGINTVAEGVQLKLLGTEAYGKDVAETYAIETATPLQNALR
jgi:diaminohydroxyphosphoribosylaminopyrimidine deaminase/5-amino-6-(5-phosphoribosylamino)uracil reductase